jgi:hypothetical protein
MDEQPCDPLSVDLLRILAPLSALFRASSILPPIHRCIDTYGELMLLKTLFSYALLIWQITKGLV